MAAAAKVQVCTQARVDRGRSLKVVCAEVVDLRHTARGLSRGLDLCESSVRAEISAVRRWAEAEVAAANARVDTLERMIKDSRCDNLSAGVGASEDTGWPMRLAGFSATAGVRFGMMRGWWQLLTRG